MKLTHKTLADCFIASARANRKRRCIADSRKSLNYGQTLTAAIAISRKINKPFAQTDKVAIMLPPSVGAVLANIAAAMDGKTAINLNYTLSVQIRATVIEQCGIKKIITSKQFLQKANLDITPCEPVFIEDLAADINLLNKIYAYFAARFLPKSFFVRPSKSGVATIIFSSGTTGIPKGVMLTNENIIANLNSITEAIKFTPDDNLCEVLPFFHSFGFSCGLWLPITIAASAVYSVNPFDTTEVGTNASKYKSTVLFAPPTFLLNYAKRIDKACFASLWIVVGGAEKLKKQVADMFEEHFGIRPLDGYGATELSPAAAMNVASANKAGTVGRPLPGVKVKIINPYDGGQLSTGQSGLVYVKGKNVMAGYFNMPDETEEAIKDGWYNTGDLGFIDEDGFLTITGRLARFSKIGGEMVPHIGVEDAYLEALGTSEQLVAVIALPDEKKGEQLIVLHLPQAGTAEKLHELISKSPLPNLWKPKPNNYIRIEEMPTLGTGKLDIGRLRKIAMEQKTV
jgi:acyl-[acyl-carrier-protein]-phospholipid O-acyltransferase/long-chain-fatty-acid--[acyl-carrier-protein] ligase